MVEIGDVVSGILKDRGWYEYHYNGEHNLKLVCFIFSVLYHNYSIFKRNNHIIVFGMNDAVNCGIVAQKFDRRDDPGVTVCFDFTKNGLQEFINFIGLR